MTKITNLSRKIVSEQWRHQALGRLELTLVVNTSGSGVPVSIIIGTDVVFSK